MERTINARVTIQRIPMIEVSNDKRSLSGAFGDIPTSLYRAINLNVTYDDREDAFGTRNENGMFDGTVGQLQRNESDFAAFAVPLEEFQGDFELPVKILNLLGQHDYHIVSNPYYNRSEAIIHLDIENSLLVISPMVIALYAVLFLVVLSAIKLVGQKMTKSCFTSVPIYYKSVVVSRARIKLNGASSSSSSTPAIKLSWNMLRYIFEQGVDMCFILETQLIYYVTFACAVGVSLCLIKNMLSADLVSYKKPILLETLQDVWDAGDSVNISLVASSSAPGVFKHSEEGSIQNRLWRRSIEQWKGVKGLNLRIFPSDLILASPQLVKKYKLAILSNDFPSKIFIGLECSRSDTDPDLYSNFYRSKKSFMYENQVQVARIGIDEELERRLRMIFTRVVESGLHELQISKGHEMTLSTIPLEFPPRLLCLNVKSWSDENNESTEQLKLENCYQFLSHISLSFILVIISLIGEHLLYKLF